MEPAQQGGLLPLSPLLDLFFQRERYLGREHVAHLQIHRLFCWELG